MVNDPVVFVLKSSMPEAWPPARQGFFTKEVFMRPLLQVLAGLLVLGFCVILFPAGSYGDTLVYTVAVPLHTTNWNQAMSIPKFTEPLACLQSICFELRGHVEGAAKFESLDAEPATVSMNLEATITLQRPDGSPLVTVIPLAHTVDAVTAFDGVIDFGGTSGKSYTGLTGNAADTKCTVDPDDFALFTGVGNINLPAVALGTSNGSGAGNLILQFNTWASAEVVVTYTYDCLVSTENSTWGQVKSIYR